MPENALDDRATRAAVSLTGNLELPDQFPASALSLVRSAIALGWAHGYQAGTADASETFAKIMERVR